ncbi:hypothetical protein E3J74_08910 [Candidatus Bathyarchaeota archaeon]|nr:MAG: hypothetical protein E3J74_08910 [Candidatus Bathyarchaeota archaeon]
MTSKMTRKTMAFIVVAVLLFSLILAVVLHLLSQSYNTELKIMVVTGEGLQETYGFYNGSHTSNSYNYYRDKFWTESTSGWFPSTAGASILVDPSKKVHGNYSILFDFNVKHLSYFFFHRVSYPYGYLAKQGDKWLYFNMMFNTTININDLEVRVQDFTGSNYFSTQYTNVSSYPPNEWIRFKIYMNDMMPFGAPSWDNIHGLQFNVQQSTRAPLKIWIDDIMMTSTYHYNLALKNLRNTFKGIDLDTRDHDKLPPNIDDYTAVIYLDNRINSTAVSIIDQYVNRGGGLVLMGLSTLWQSDGTERVDFPLSASPVSILNSTETFIDNADKVDSFKNHPALKPWNNYTIFSQRGYVASRPMPYLGIAEIYNVSLRAGATSLITESGYIYEATRQYGAGKVVYFAENLAKRIANGMLEAIGLPHGFGSRGWGGATGDRLQLLESAVNYVSKHPLPKMLMVPFAKKGGFVFTVDTSASIDLYWYLNQSCKNILGSYSNDTAFWYTVQRMKNQSEETGVTYTLLIATTQLTNEFRAGHDETEFNPKNLEALLAAYQSPNIEIGLSSSNTKTWPIDATSSENSYQNMWQGVLDIRNALNLSNYELLTWRYPILARRGESMYGTAKAGLYLDVSDERGSVVVPYLMEANTWKLQGGGVFSPIIESGEWARKREETFFDWFVENDMIYHVFTNDWTIAADPSHIHQREPAAPEYPVLWNQTPIFLQYVSSQSENTWIVGGVTLAQYLKNWTAAEVSTTYDSKTRNYTFAIQNAPDGLTVRLPLNGMHVSAVESDVDYILKEEGDYAYLALKNPKASETVKVTLGSTKHSEISQSIRIPITARQTTLQEIMMPPVTFGKSVLITRQFVHRHLNPSEG